MRIYRAVAMNPRRVNLTVVDGFFLLPMGIQFHRQESLTRVEVSTICLEGGHLDDPLKVCEPEHGYETMVFPEGSCLFSVFTVHYETREEAERGHRDTVERLLAGTLPLAIPITATAGRIA